MDQALEVMNMDQAGEYLQVGRDKLVEFINRRAVDNPLPHIRTSETNSRHSPALFRRAWLDAWLDKECERQTGLAPLDSIRRAG